MKLKHPKELLESKESQRYAKLEAYLDENPPTLADFKYIIQLTDSLKNIITVMGCYGSPEQITGLIAEMANRDIIQDEVYLYKYECTYLYNRDGVDLVLTPKEIRRH